MLELLNVNPSSGEPIYRQLHDQIVRLIVGGQLQAQQLGVALDELQALIAKKWAEK